MADNTILTEPTTQGAPTAPTRRQRIVSTIATVVKLLLAALFLFSAASKFVSIDKFEIYIYTFRFCPLSIAFIVARLVIGGELLLGLWLLSGRYARGASLTALLVTLAFTLFLCIAHLSGRTDSCNCFGDLLPFSPVQSIVKNAILILLLLAVWRWAPRGWQPHWWVSLLTVVVPWLLFTALALTGVTHVKIISFQSLCVLFAVVLVVALVLCCTFSRRHWVEVLLALAPMVTLFIVSPPDNWFRDHYRNEPFQADLFRQALHSSTLLGQYDIHQGRQVLCFISANCPYCRLAAEKISTIQQRADLDSTAITYVFAATANADSSSANATHFSRFYAETQTLHYREALLNADTFLHITYGQFPVIVFLDADTLVGAYNYRSITETDLRNFIGTPHKNHD